MKATQEYLRSYFQNSNLYDRKYDASLLNLQDFHSQDCDTGLLCSDGGELQEDQKEDQINVLKKLHFSRLRKGRSEFTRERKYLGAIFCLMYSDKPNGYYPDFLIDNSLDIPNEVSEVLHNIWVQKYEELYEVDSKQGRSLLEAISKALETLQDRNPTLEHLRCVWCGYILGLAVKPTVESYSSGDCRALVVLKATQEYLRSYFQNSNLYDWKYDASLLNLQDFHSQGCDTSLLYSDGGEFQEDRINVLKKLHFSRLMKGRSEGPQALDEALDVFLNILDLMGLLGLG